MCTYRNNHVRKMQEPDSSEMNNPVQGNEDKDIFFNEDLKGCIRVLCLNRIYGSRIRNKALPRDSIRSVSVI